MKFISILFRFRCFFSSIWNVNLFGNSNQRIRFSYSHYSVRLMLAYRCKYWKIAPMKLFYLLAIHLCISLNINSHFICCVRVCVRACVCVSMVFFIYILSIRCYADRVIALKQKWQSKCKHFVYKIKYC